MKSKNPLIVILGATGSGKTKLSLELAQKLNTEIIGADSMQLYKGLDIITAKATPQEQQMAPHHLIDILNPRQYWTVVEYRNKALEIIRDIIARDKIPIIVGGTNYYIESLLWKILVDEPGSALVHSPTADSNNYRQLPNEELHRLLQQFDPVMSKRLHPNNRRKILRSLEIFHEKGIRHSDILKDQHSLKGASNTGGPLRFPNALILWLQCNQDVLDKRLDKRVDCMIEEGLLQELQHFHTAYNKDRIKTSEIADYTTGVFQSIGFKEFHKYLMLSVDDRVSDTGKKLLEEGINNLKIATRRYSRKQCKWIQNRFLGRADREVPSIYGLSTDDVNNWNENITRPALELVETFMNGEPSKYEPISKKIRNSFSNSEDHTFYCDACDRIFVGKHQWEAHQNSAKHKKVQCRKNKA